MATWHGVKLKDGPEGIDRVDRIDRYSDGHERDGYALNSRNQPITWPQIETGETQADDDGGTYPVMESAPEAILEGGTVRAATAEELAAIQAWSDGQEQARIAALAADHGADLMMLDVLMRKVGLSYPTAPAVAEAHLLSLVQSGDEAASVVALLIDKQWQRLAHVENDLLAIWAAIQP